MDLQITWKNHGLVISIKAPSNPCELNGLWVPIKAGKENFQIRWSYPLQCFFFRGDSHTFLEKVLALKQLDQGDDGTFHITWAQLGPGYGEGFVELALPSFLKEAHKNKQLQNVIVKSPITGNVLKVFVKNGDLVHSGQPIATIEAMKMENQILSPRAGMLEDLKIKPLDKVMTGQTLASIRNDPK